MSLLVFRLLSVLVFARPQQKICCANPNSCVAWDECFAPNAVGADVDGDGDLDYCQGGSGTDSGYWWDCGFTAGDSAACGDIDIGTKFPNIVPQYCDGSNNCQLKIDDLCRECTKN